MNVSGKNLISILKAPTAPTNRSGTGIAALLTKGNSVVTSEPRLPSAWKPRAEDGGLVFVIDATLSREAAWQETKSIQARMFTESAAIGAFSARMIHFQGNATVEVFPRHHWAQTPNELVQHMNGIECARGNTQIERAFKECLALTQRPKAVVAIGDDCEEKIADIRLVGREMGKMKIPVFAFHEGDDEGGRVAYQTLAKESGGAYAKFGSKLDLSSLITAAAAYSAGGQSALLQLANRPGQGQLAAQTLVRQITGPA